MLFINNILIIALSRGAYINVVTSSDASGAAAYCASPVYVSCKYTGIADMNIFIYLILLVIKMPDIYWRKGMLNKIDIPELKFICMYAKYLNVDRNW